MGVFKFKEVLLEELDAVLPEAEYAFLAPKNNPDSTTSQLLGIRSNQKGFYAFATYNNEDICSFIIIWPYKEEETIAIGPMFVREQYRGKGIGKYQVEELIKWSKGNNIKGIFTKTWESNNTSRAIFESTGFSKIGEKPGG